MKVNTADRDRRRNFLIQSLGFVTPFSDYFYYMFLTMGKTSVVSSPQIAAGSIVSPNIIKARQATSTTLPDPEAA